jgi:dihydroorotate dehydrogenase
MPLYDLLRPLLFRLDAERAHALALAALSRGWVRPPARPPDPALRVDLWGLSFPNPLGLAAGFDKGGSALDGSLALGFGFVEIGSVTPLPQPGNPPPRIFRLASEESIINRLGFNSEGHAAVAERLGRRRPNAIVGVNLGANRESADRVGDYVLGLSRFNDLASYLVVNVSSPNTPGLRDLQARRELGELAERLAAARSQLKARAPLLLKISPDLSDEELRAVADVATGGAFDGIIVSNTTTARPGVSSGFGTEPGGLSGRLLFPLATRMLARLHVMTGGRLPLVGTGGVDSADAAWEKVRAGASLVQLYSALVFKGPRLVADIVDGLSARLAREKAASLADIVGTGAGDWL